MKNNTLSLHILSAAPDRDSYKQETIAFRLEKFVQLLHLFQAVFEMDEEALPSIAYLSDLLDDDSFICIAALEGDKVVGGLTGYVLAAYYSEKPSVYLYDLAVSVAYRRQGIGSQLIDSLTAYCRQIQAEELYVQADVDDLHALDFYRKTGAMEAKVIHFTYTLDSGTNAV